MRNVYFLLSHFQSGADHLGNALAAHPRILYLSTNYKYDHVDDVEALERHEHKCNHCGAITIDGIFTNQQMHSKSILLSYPAIYVLGEPKQTVARLIQYQNIDPSKALRYYFSRLHRLLRLSRRTKRGVILTSSALGNCNAILEDFMRIDGLQLNVTPPISDVVIPNDVLQMLEIRFEKYYYKFKNCDLPLY